ALVCALIAYIARQTYQTAILRWLVAVMAVILLWATSEFFIRISATVQTAIIFKYWEIAGYILIGPTAVGLSLAYVRKEKFLSQIKWLALLFLPACVFIYAAWTQNAFVNFSDYI